MSREAILKIKDAELQAAETVAQARARAQKMREDALREGEALCQTAEEETLSQRAEMMRQLDEKAKELSALTEQQAREEADQISKDVRMRRRIAEKIIIRGLDTKCR